MSWFIGVIKKNTEISIRKKLEEVHPEALYRYQMRNLYLACGGFEKTCFTKFEKKDPKNRSGWVACGVGIQKTDTNFSFMTHKDWDKTLSNSHFDLCQLNGHFITIVWNQDNFLFRNDQLGLRDCYFTKINDAIMFSTRLDWLAKLINNCDIDVGVFSSSWNLVNSLSYDCFITHIKRLGPGGMAKIESNQLITKNTLWQSEYAPECEFDDIVSLAKKFTLFPLKNEHKLNLALSGGLDSRTLFSILLTTDYKNWNVLTFGESKLPDIIISK